MTDQNPTFLAYPQYETLVRKLAGRLSGCDEVSIALNDALICEYPAETPMPFQAPTYSGGDRDALDFLVRSTMYEMRSNGGARLVSSAFRRKRATPGALHTLELADFGSLPSLFTAEDNPARHCFYCRAELHPIPECIEPYELETSVVELKGSEAAVATGFSCRRYGWWAFERERQFEVECGGDPSPACAVLDSLAVLIR